MRTFVLTLATSLFLVSPVWADEDATENEEEKKEETLKCDKPLVITDGIKYETTGKIFDKTIPCLQRGELTEIIINSTGGEAGTGFGIYDALTIADTEGVLTTTVYGSGHSVAVNIFLAGTVRQISCHSSMLVHKARMKGSTFDDSDDARADADRHDQISDQNIDIYVRATGITREAAKALIEEERYLYADELLERNFATKIIGCD